MASQLLKPLTQPYPSGCHVFRETRSPIPIVDEADAAHLDKVVGDGELRQCCETPERVRELGNVVAVEAQCLESRQRLDELRQL